MVRNFLTSITLLLVIFTLSSCNHNKSEVINLGNRFCGEHDFADWNTLVESTAISEGLKQRVCKVCGFCETDKISKKALSYNVAENGEKFFEVQIPVNQREITQNDVSEDRPEIKIVINENEKTITIEGDTLPSNMTIDDVKTDIKQTLIDNGIILGSDFDFDVKIPGFEDEKDNIPTPY